MVTWLIGSAMRLRRLVVAAVIAVLGLGLLQLQSAPVDVYPEFEATHVQVQAEALGLSAQEVEQLITVPIEQDLLNGVPWLRSIRSRSMPGLSAIDLVFEPGTDLYRARQMVQERMSQAKALPNVGTPPAVIQPKSSTSRVAMVALRSSDVSMIEMSVLARWQIRPRLMSIPGVSQVSIFGQQDRQLQVQVDPKRLKARNVTLTQLIETAGNALWVSPLSFVEASTPGTGGFVETPNQRLGVQHVQPITSADQLADVALEGAQGGPVRLGDVSSVVEDHQPQIGSATDAGQKSLMLVVERFPGANTAQVTHDVQDALAAMQPGLKGITVDTSLYQPVRYLDSALHRVGIAVLVGAILLALVIGVLRRSWRVAVVAVASAATSVVTALWVLHLRGDTLTSMTLIGLAAVMALVVDDAVGDAADLRSRLRQRREEGQPAVVALLVAGVTSRRGPLTYATLITALALVPLFLIPGAAGALVSPAAVTALLAVAVSLVVAHVVTPVLADLLLRGGNAPSRWMRTPGWALRGLNGLTARSVGRPLWAGLTLAVLALLVLPGLVLLHKGDILPAAQDRSVLVRLQGAQGTGLSEMNRITTAAAAELAKVPGIRTAGTHVGRAIASDRVADVNSGEIWVTVAQDADYDGTLQAVRTAIRGYPGLRTSVQTYEADRLAAAGATTGNDLVVRVYGQDLATLASTAEDVRQVIQTVGGVISPTVQTQVTQPTVEIQVDLAAAQRVGLRPGDIRRDASTLISGLTVGSLYQDQAIFDVVLWTGAPSRASLGSLQSLLIDTPSGAKVPLGSVARVHIAPDPSVITHDAVSRSLDVTAQVRGRSASAVAQDVTTQLRRMNFPYEYRAEVVGDAVARSQSNQLILLAAVVVGLLIYLLLQAATGTWRGAAVLMVTVPFAATGGLLIAEITGSVLSGGVLAGLGAVGALALRHGLTLVRRAQTLYEQGDAAGECMRHAVQEGTPALVTSVAATGALFLPAAAMGGGAGLELLQPFAITLLAGLVTHVAIVLFVLPNLYPAPTEGVQPAPTASEAAAEGRHAEPRPEPRSTPLPGPRSEARADLLPAGQRRGMDHQTEEER
jgi:Cu/Ag efflux pump CusA